MKVTLRQSAVIPQPILDDDGQPVQAVKKWRGRETKVVDVETPLMPAGSIVTVDDAVGEQMIKDEIATEYDAALDGDDI
ncbi:hypothetical protein [Methylocystis hirsuta]|uniref:Uncharacterized protein n=1 Tax=Methylocystis hirsuta TaxID=369798 RepID=A0A3M9XQI7_9HYPH|nr:hypothetical protein [Methylocystis hirsuta]RNJ49368.1 hypothetical protein D1O30_06910 [Methylocystis hirsuta]